MLPFLHAGDNPPRIGPTSVATDDDVAGLHGVAETMARLFKAEPLKMSMVRPESAFPAQAFFDVFRASEAQMRLVDNAFAQDRSMEDAYDRQIAAVKAATGVELENPLRGGYTREAAVRARRLRQGTEAATDESAPEYRARLYQGKLAELQLQHPDLDPGDLPAMARDIAHGAETGAQAVGKAAGEQGLGPVGTMAAQFAGGMWAGRRDPLFVGSLFFGPTSALGKTALARITTSGLFQGLYNAGISALEQPEVQRWRGELGLRSGVQPAIENVGLAFMFGLIPGAAFRGGHEWLAARPAAERLLRGAPEAGDIDKLRALLHEIDPDKAAAVRMGEDMLAADQALLPKPARGLPPELHDDLTAAALRHADDPLGSPSPEAVATLDAAKRPLLVVARRMPDNSVRYGEPGQLHADLVDPTEHAAIRSGETFPPPTDDMGFAVPGGKFMSREDALAFVKANEPARAALAHAPTGLEATKYRDSVQMPLEISDRIAAARPITQHEAEMAASEAIEDIGNRRSMAGTRERMDADRLPAPEPPPEGTTLPPARSQDPLDKIPLARDDGTPRIVAQRDLAKVAGKDDLMGERFGHYADIIRECK